MTLQTQELTDERMAQWEPVIGLEIHTQLKTNTKMFCRCRLEFGAAPNTHTCPVCLAHPGVLPVPNERAVDFAIRIGLALNCEIAPRTTFSRKNYFYADSPKAYQISQYEDPICGKGEMLVPGAADGGEDRVGITRAHMEEDAAKLVHAGGASGRINDSHASTVDFNRGGTPLVEIVTEPDIRSAEAAKRFLTLLKNTLETIGVSDVNMEEGSLRCDANISVRPRGETKLGTKTELKNMNSFRFIERGIDAEIARQIAILERGDEVEQETLHYEAATGELTSLRSKEQAHDYRYFPEPDLVPIVVTPEHVERVRADMPELPYDRMHRFAREFSLSVYDAEVLNGSAGTAQLFEDAVAAATDADAKLVANWVMGEYLANAKDGNLATAQQVAATADLVARKAVNVATAKEVFARVAAGGPEGDPAAIVEAEGLGLVQDEGALRKVVEDVIAANEKQVAQYRSGKTAIVGFFVGQVMKAMQGKGDPQAAKAMLIEVLGPVDPEE